MIEVAAPEKKVIEAAAPEKKAAEAPTMVLTSSHASDMPSFAAEPPREMCPLGEKSIEEVETPRAHIRKEEVETARGRARTFARAHAQARCPCYSP